MPTPPVLPCPVCPAQAGELCKPTDEWPDWNPMVVHKPRLDLLAATDAMRGVVPAPPETTIWISGREEH